MRQNILFALLGACCALLVANLAMESRPSSLPPAFAQTGGGVVMSASNTQNEAFVFLFDSGAKKLAAYAVKGNKGLEYRGVRSTEFDFRASEFPSSNARTAVKNMRKALEKHDKKK